MKNKKEKCGEGVTGMRMPMVSSKETRIKKKKRSDEIRDDACATESSLTL